MAEHHYLRRLFLITMLVAIVALSLLTVRLVGPAFREPCLQAALDKSAGPSFWWPPSWRQELRILTKLQDPVTLEFVETPLMDVMEFLHDFTGATFSIDQASLERSGVLPDTPVSIHVQQISLGSALNVLLHDIDAKWRIERDSIQVTTRGPNERAMPEVSRPKESTPAELRLNDCLQEPVTLDFVETPLSDVIDFLRDFAGVGIVVDRKRLAQHDVAADTPITVHAHSIPLNKALSKVLNPFDATYRIENEVLWITTKD